MYVCVYVCAFIYIYIFVYTFTADRWIDGWIDRQIDRSIDTKANESIDRFISRKRIGFIYRSIFFIGRYTHTNTRPLTHRILPFFFFPCPRSCLSAKNHRFGQLIAVDTDRDHCILHIWGMLPPPVALVGQTMKRVKAPKHTHRDLQLGQTRRYTCIYTYTFTV